MKKHQFEEITAALSIIICVLAYHFGIMWLFYIYMVKAIFDSVCAYVEGFLSARKSSLQRKINEADKA